MSWIAGSLLVLAVALAAGFAWYERTHPAARVVALIATLAGLAALGRIAFAPLPNVKPTTDIVLIAGYALGGAPGFAVGALAALVSNVFFGQGPWTPWQMAGWGLVGAGGAVLASITRGRLGRWGLAAACGAAGLAFGVVMNLYLWVTWSGGDHSAARFAAYSASSLPFDVAHAAGNVAFCLAFGPALVAALRRFRRRMDVAWVPVSGRAGRAAGTAAVVAVAAVVVVAAASAPPAHAGPAADAARYVASAQNSDGGFGADPRGRSTPMHSGWAALGLAAAGRNPLDVRTGGRSVLGYLVAHADEVSDLGEVSRTVLVLAAAGRNPRNFAGRNLVRELAAERRRNGSWAGRVNSTAFAVLAMRAAGRGPRKPAVRRGARWIAGQANVDGGFNFAGRGGASGVDDTSAAVQALVAAGRRGTRTVRRAVRFLARRQNSDGGFPLTPGGASNAQSTAWATQAFVAAGRNPAKVRRNGSRSPLRYLASLTEPGGAVRYSRTSRQTPVWVTSQALAAFARKPFPLSRIARRSRASGSPAPRPTPSATATATPAATAEAPDPAPSPEPAETRTKGRAAAVAPVRAVPAAPAAVGAWARVAGVVAAVLL